MIPNQYVALIDKLIEKTENGELKWETTSNSNTFTCPIKSNRVLIAYQLLPEGYGHPEMENIRFELQALGETIDVVSESYDDTVEGDQLYLLYDLARRSALKIDATIKDILRDLD